MGMAEQEMRKGTAFLKKQMELIGSTHTAIGYDPYYVNWSATEQCFDSYMNYRLCSVISPGSFSLCSKQFFTASGICPIDWMNKWDEQILNDAFPIIPPHLQSRAKAAVELEQEQKEAADEALEALLEEEDEEDEDDEDEVEFEDEEED